MSNVTIPRPLYNELLNVLRGTTTGVKSRTMSDLAKRLEPLGRPPEKPIHLVAKVSLQQGYSIVIEDPDGRVVFSEVEHFRVGTNLRILQVATSCLMVRAMQDLKKTIES